MSIFTRDLNKLPACVPNVRKLMSDKDKMEKCFPTIIESSMVTPPGTNRRDPAARHLGLML